jgi:hypothetical protein
MTMPSARSGRPSRRWRASTPPPRATLPKCGKRIWRPRASGYQMQQRQADANECERAGGGAEGPDSEQSGDMPTGRGSWRPRRAGPGPSPSDRRAAGPPDRDRRKDGGAAASGPPPRRRAGRSARAPGPCRPMLEALRQKEAVETASAAEARALLSALACRRPGAAGPGRGGCGRSWRGEQKLLRDPERMPPGPGRSWPRPGRTGIPC